jgi:parallel beta-helix repeat protein
MVIPYSARFGVLCVALLFAFLCYDVSAVNISCNNCSDCARKINDSSAGDVVLLSSDIIDQHGTCIYLEDIRKNVLFDCQGHTIDGDDSVNSSGIYMRSVNGFSIKGCRITDFFRGIQGEYVGANISDSVIFSNNQSGIHIELFLFGNILNNSVGESLIGVEIFEAYYNNISGNIFSNNGDAGIIEGGEGLRLSMSYLNRVYDNKFEGNTKFSIVIDGYPYCYDDVFNNSVGRHGKPLLFIQNSTGYLLENTDEYGEIYICNSSEGTIRNVTLEDGYGITLFVSNNYTISNSRFTNVPYAINMQYSGRNTVSGNTFSSNWRAVFMQGAVFNYWDRNYSSWENIVINNSFDKNTIGVYMSNNASQNLITGNHIRSSAKAGIRISDSWNNSIWNNELSDNSNGIYVDGCDEWDCHQNSSANTLGKNRVCASGSYDILNYSIYSNRGMNNTCDVPYSWNDLNASGCAYPCSATTTSTSTTTTSLGQCELLGNEPPCEQIGLSEVVSMITLWSTGDVQLADVINIINAWASSP